MQTILLISHLLVTNWINISGEIKKNNALNWDYAKVILTSENVFLEESILTKEGHFNLDYLVQGETIFEFKLVYNSFKDTVLLKEVEQFESQNEVWNFDL